MQRIAAVRTDGRCGGVSVEKLFEHAGVDSLLLAGKEEWQTFGRVTHFGTVRECTEKLGDDENIRIVSADGDMNGQVAFAVTHAHTVGKHSDVHADRLQRRVFRCADLMKLVAVTNSSL